MRPMAPTADRRNRIFVDGYLSGEAGACDSPRTVAARFPTLAAWEIETYLAGQDDGRVGDLWRIHNMGADDVLGTMRGAR